MMLLNCGVGEDSWETAILKEINLDYSLEGLMLMLMLKLQYFRHLMWRANSLGKTDEIEGRGRKQHRTKWLDDIINSMDMSLSRLWERVKDMKAWCAIVHGITKSWIWLNKTTKSDFVFNILHARRWSNSKLCLLSRRIQNSGMNIIHVCYYFFSDLP